MTPYADGARRTGRARAALLLLGVVVLSACSARAQDEAPTPAARSLAYAYGVAAVPPDAKPSTGPVRAGAGYP